MRRLLAPLSRWLDRRIDARIAAVDQHAALPAGHFALAEMAAAGIRCAATVQREGR